MSTNATLFKALHWWQLFTRKLSHLLLKANVRANECISRGNYGSLLIEMKLWDRVAEQLQKSIDIGTDIYPIAANVFQGMLAYLRSLENNHELAITILTDINYTLIQTDVESTSSYASWLPSITERRTTIKQLKPLKKPVLSLRNINFRILRRLTPSGLKPKSYWNHQRSDRPTGIPRSCRM